MGLFFGSVGVGSLLLFGRSCLRLHLLLLGLDYNPNKNVKKCKSARDGASFVRLDTIFTYMTYILVRRRRRIGT